MFFTVKSPSVTQRSVSQENAFNKTIGSNNSFTLIEKENQVFKIAKCDLRFKNLCAISYPDSYFGEGCHKFSLVLLSF